jgi:hypothetical protein
MRLMGGSRASRAASGPKANGPLIGAVVHSAGRTSVQRLRATKNREHVIRRDLAAGEAPKERRFHIRQRHSRHIVLGRDPHRALLQVYGQRDAGGFRVVQDGGDPVRSGRVSGPFSRLDGSQTKAPGFAGGYLPQSAHWRTYERL